MDTHLSSGRQNLDVPYLNCSLGASTTHRILTASSRTSYAALVAPTRSTCLRAVQEDICERHCALLHRGAPSDTVQVRILADDVHVEVCRDRGRVSAACSDAGTQRQSSPSDP